MNKTKGLIAATFTPMKADGSINYSMIPRYYEYLKQTGVSGVFINGTTGEFASLSVSERLKIAETWKETISSDFKIFIHIGTNSLSDIRQLAAHASSLEADAVGMISPSFFKPGSIEDLVSFCADAAGYCPETPFYYYHMPAMTGVNHTMVDFLKLAGSRIPNLKGLKFTHEDLMDMALCIDFENKKFDILHGRDEILLSGLVLGVSGAVGSTYNYTSPLFNQLISALNDCDLKMAKELQIIACKFIRVLIEYGGGIVAGKYFMKHLGLDLGPLRLPLTGFDQHREEKMILSLEAVRFFDHCLKADMVLS